MLDGEAARATSKAESIDGLECVFPNFQQDCLFRLIDDNVISLKMRPLARQRGSTAYLSAFRELICPLCRYIRFQNRYGESVGDQRNRPHFRE